MTTRKYREHGYQVRPMRKFAGMDQVIYLANGGLSSPRRILMSGPDDAARHIANQRWHAPSGGVRC